MSEAPITTCVVTGSRSEYGLLRWLMQEFQDAPRFSLRLAVTGNHFDATWGRTIDEIKADGFTIDDAVEVVLNTESDAALTRSVAEMTAEFASAFERNRPDLVVVMGDRYELLAISTVCVLMNIPIAHISGGEITGGAIDDQIRNAMTKLSHLHFVANEDYGKRVRQMGEEDWRICVSGEPGLDNVTRLELWSARQLGDDLGLDLTKPTALVTFHPVTLERDQAEQHITAVIDALQQADMQYILTYPNADLGCDRVIAALTDFHAANESRSCLVKSLGQLRYLSALRHADMMIGNSSSALFEAPSFNMPAVNIGSRQAGRMRAENVIDVDCETAAILAGIGQARTYDRSVEIVNPYGDGHSSERVRSFIGDIFSRLPVEALLKKKFADPPA